MDTMEELNMPSQTMCSVTSWRGVALLLVMTSQLEGLSKKQSSHCRFARNLIILVVSINNHFLKGLEQI